MTVATKQFEAEPTCVAPGQDRRHELGQFLTPRRVADFMASLFDSRWQEWNLLDAGAGSQSAGSLHSPDSGSLEPLKSDKLQLVASTRPAEVALVKGAVVC